MEQTFKIPSKAELVKYSIYAAIGIVVLIILIIAIKKISAAIKTDSLVKESKRSVVNRNLTYDDFTYKQIAASIFEAADGMGTDEDTIYRNIDKIKNIDDWKMLISVYGTDDDKFNLVGRLVYELDSSEKARVNQSLSIFGESI